jgi:hypothetical protein
LHTVIAPQSMLSQPSAVPAPVSVICKTVRCCGNLAVIACWCNRQQPGTSILSRPSL